MNATDTTLPAAPVESTAPGMGLVSAAASIAMGVVTLSMIIVNVAMPAMSRDLNAPLATIQWASTAFVLGLMTSVALTSWASARLGVKRLLLGALAVFMVASALSGISWSIGMLIASRYITGLAGGILFPLGQAVVVRAARGVGIAKAMSVLNAPILVVPVFGPLLGGVLIVGLSWRWVFLICVPIAGVGLALSARVLHDDEPEPSGPLDLGGLALLSSGLVLVVYGLSLLGHGATEKRAWLVMGCGALLTIAFVLHAQRRGQRALLNISLFKKRTFAAPVAIAALFNFVLFGSAAVVPLYFESVRGQSAIVAGALVGAQGLGSLLGMVASGSLTDHYGPRSVASIAAVFVLLGTVPWVLLGDAGGYASLLMGLVIRGAALSAMMIAAYAVGYETLDSAAIPGATAAFSMVGRVSAAAGVAVAAVVIQRRAPDVVDSPGGIDAGAASSAFSTTFALLAAVGVAALVPALMLPGRRRRPRSQLR